MKNTTVVPHVLLPKKGTDMTKWAVVACDQFTSEPKYWEELKDYVGSAPSALNVIFPEVYLGKDDAQRIDAINANMDKYLKSGVWEDTGACFVLIERSTPYTERRLGLVAAVDLEDYSFIREDKALIRATEGTVVSRIPPRVKIRENAPVELPHIMLLIDDRKKEIIEGLYAQRESLEKVYDFELNMKGGHIRGWKVTDTGRVISQLNSLISPEAIKEKYGDTDEIMLYAVGDGNHSLATAKACWDNVKKSLAPEKREDHPARFAMVEIENLHDEGLAFEPIHRAVFNADKDFTEGLLKLSGGEYECEIITKEKTIPFMLSSNAALAVKTVQDYIDGYIAAHGGVQVDYVHGTDSLRSVACENEGTVGITLPPLSKYDLFDYVLKKGAFPRKTFSMGEAVEKRYYVEARKIKE